MTNAYDITLNPVLREQIELEQLNDALYNADEARRANVRRQMDISYNFERINRNHDRYLSRAVDVEFTPVITEEEAIAQEARSLTGAWTFLGAGVMLILAWVKAVFLP